MLVFVQMNPVAEPRSPLDCIRHYKCDLEYFILQPHNRPRLYFLALLRKNKQQRGGQDG